MNVLLVALGSHGDVHPFVGIGLALRARGHRVRVIANSHFAKLVEGAGLDFAPIGTSEEYRRLATNPALWQRLQGSRVVLAAVGELIRPLYETIAQNHIPGETVVAASSLALGARVAQDKLGIPTATVHLQPSIFLSTINPPRLPGVFMPAWMPHFLRRAQFSLVERFVDSLIGPPLNAFRRELGLEPVRRILGQYVHSPQRVIGLFPDWFAPPQPDWPEQVRLTGFPLYDERAASGLPEDLLRFLDEGDPPIAFTPGSAMWSAHQFFEQSARAAQMLGRRGLLLTRHPDHIPQALPPGVRHVAYAPFSQLLPRCAAIVHHGGIGSSAQALAAGVPQLVMPHAHDQPDNAARLIRLGVARKVEPKRYRAPVVARMLNALLDSVPLKARCQEAAARFVRADPVGKTCELIEDLPDVAVRPSDALIAPTADRAR